MKSRPQKPLSRWHPISKTRFRDLKINSVIFRIRSHLRKTQNAFSKKQKLTQNQKRKSRGRSSLGKKKSLAPPTFKEDPLTSAARDHTASTIRPSPYLSVFSRRHSY